MGLDIFNTFKKKKKMSSDVASLSPSAQISTFHNRIQISVTMEPGPLHRLTPVDQLQHWSAKTFATLDNCQHKDSPYCPLWKLIVL